MANYKDLIGDLLEAEGGSKYTNRKADRGGPTKWGVTLSTLRRYRGRKTTATDVKNLGKAEAVEIYRTKYWDINRTTDIKNWVIAKILFDQAVNRGPKTGARIMQKSCNRLPGKKLKVDGKPGPKTLKRVNSLRPSSLANEMIKEAQDQYVGIAKSDLTQMANLAGWINRSQKLMDSLIDFVNTHNAT